MEGAESLARSCAQELASAWLAGDYDRMSHLCDPGVGWWTPLSGETVSGPGGARAELERILRPLARPIEITAVLANDDGTRCVVEMMAPAGAPDAPPAFVTSVLTVRNGKISAGRTYVDVRFHRPVARETA